jgi:hypothetical protein
MYPGKMLKRKQPKMILTKPRLDRLTKDAYIAVGSISTIAGGTKTRVILAKDAIRSINTNGRFLLFMMGFRKLVCNEKLRSNNSIWKSVISRKKDKA